MTVTQSGENLVVEYTLATSSTSSGRQTKKKTKKKRGHDSDSDEDFRIDDDDLKPMASSTLPRAGFSAKNRSKTHIEFCSQCKCRFTVENGMEYIFRNETGLMICTACKSGKTSVRRPAKRKRRVPGTGAGDDGIEITTLQDLCIQLIAKYIEDVEALGDIGLVNMDKICKIISKNRSLNTQTARLFLDSSEKQIRLYDCTNIEEQGLLSISNYCPHLESLHLDFCGRINDTVIRRYADLLPNLRHFSIHGPYRVTPAAWLYFFEKLGHQLETFSVDDTHRFNADCLRALISRASDLKVLRLKRLGLLDDEMVSMIAQLDALDVLDLTEPRTTDQYQTDVHVSPHAIITVLNKLGSSLEEFVLTGFTSLTDDVLLEGILPTCTHLRKLSLSSCDLITSPGLVKLFRTWTYTRLNPGLTHLDVSRCTHLQDMSLFWIVAHSGTTLQFLNVNSCDELSSMAFYCIAGALTADRINEAIHEEAKKEHEEEEEKKKQEKSKQKGKRAQRDAPATLESPNPVGEAFAVELRQPNGMLSHEIDQLAAQVPNISPCSELRILDTAFVRAVDDEVVGTLMRSCLGLKCIKVYGDHKVFQDHIVDQQEDGTCLLYIDRHLVHEVTSPQAFEGLKNANRKVRRPDNTLATVDHNIPTIPRKTFKSMSTFIDEAESRTQCMTLETNVREFGLTYFGMDDKRQGIVHVIGPEQGFTLPGTTVVCGDSHTATHGAFGALAFGIGTSEVEHVLATQTLLQKKSKNMRITVDGALPEGVTSKDIILHAIGLIGTAGGTGCVIEYAGSAIRSLSMEARMSICNMSIEAGARAGMIAPDEITLEYLKDRPLAPQGAEWDRAVEYWKSLVSDGGAKYDVEVHIDAADIAPTISWGTSPQDVVPITGSVPDPAEATDPAKKAGMERALEYMGLKPNTLIEDIVIDKVFIGSCTNSRIEDLRQAAKVVHGRHVAPNIYAMVVPGSGLVKDQAEAEGLDRVFKDAGFDWREAGCSMCLGMNPDQLKPGERCASTSNRNFEGRQGAGGRTHLCSPAMAAAAAIAGHLVDVRKFVGSASGAADHDKPKITILDPKSFLREDNYQLLKVAEEEAADQASEVTDAPRDTNLLSGGNGGMPAFTVLKGIAAPLDRSNVDTDAIIPKQFLKTIKRTGLGKSLFFPLRYDPKTGEENPDFVLNKEPYRQAKILICTGPNFGCGSSREHAPWALNDFGIRCIICTSFADIFFNNTFKNGMLPLTLPQEQVDILAQDAREGLELDIDLENQVIRRPNGETIPFTVESFRRHCLLNGLDDIGLTLQKEDKIASFEARRSETWPWLDGKQYREGGEPVRLTPVKVNDAKKQKLD
ncbi:hypothetical protein BZG36_05108, partial [Bifiguratus adelaidae]